MRRRWITGPAVLAALALLTGCVSIPTAGGVTTQQIQPEDPDTLLTLAAPPAEDATPAEIIAGFLRAGRGPQDNYSVARQYLTDDFRKDWIPGARTLISATPFAPEPVGDDLYSVTISASAAVDSQGRYRTASPATSHELEFELVQDDEEQWRISAAPDGTVLSADRFASIFAPYELFFFDASYRHLVPDLRWYRAGSGVANRVVDGLLAGPGERMAGALFSAFPTGAVAGDPVIADGVATIELGPDAGAASVAEHRRMQQQLLQSLRSVLTLREVVLTVGGFEIEVPQGGVQPEVGHLVANDPVGGTSDGRVGVLGPEDGVTPLSGVGTQADGLGARAGSIVSRDRDHLALLTDAGVTLIEAGRDPLVVDTRAGLVAPSLDPLGWTWVVPEDAPAELRAYSRTGTRADVPGLPVDGRVVSLDVSRDGARLLVLLDTTEGSRLLVLGIQRGADLVPTGVVSPWELAIGDITLLDAAWVDGVTVVALGDGALNAVDAFQIGGQRTSLGALSGARSIVGGNGMDGTRVLDVDGNVLRPGGGTSWEDTGLDAAFLITQQ